jgi:hypothetical protein
MKSSWTVCLLALALIPRTASAQFSLDLTFSGDFSPSQETIIRGAASYWEQQLVGYQPGISLTGIPVSIEAVNFDGLGGVIASGGPLAGTYQGGFGLTTSGRIRFDIPDLGAAESAGTLPDVAAHELAHVIGFGQMWIYNNVYVNGSGQYTGAFALDAYRSEFDPGAAFVPVELMGGAGTADGHWDENTDGIGLTGITDSLGRDLANELMTGWDGPAPPVGGEMFVSQTTLHSFRDIGFVLAPEPNGSILCALSGLVLFLHRRRLPLAP